MVQEALLRAWQLAARCTPDGKPNGLLRFCLRAARNLAISEMRRQRVTAVELDELLHHADADAEDWSAPDPLLRQLIADCRERLPKQPGRALGARLQGGGVDPDRVLAAALGMQLNTFLQNITRARKLLADCLQRAGVDLGLEMP